MANSENQNATPLAEGKDASASEFSTITLATPITRGETLIEKVTLRKPKAGELRGLNLQDLLTSDVVAIIKVIPRISDPILNQPDIDNLDPADFAEMGGTIRSFFMTASEKKAVEMLMEEQQPKT